MDLVISRFLGEEVIIKTLLIVSLKYEENSQKILSYRKMLDKYESVFEDIFIK